MRWMLLFVVALTTFARPAAADPAPSEFKDGDRIAFVGSTIVEREQTFGWLETFLYTRYPDRNITLRNLGWSGDNVWGESRAGFGKVADGYNLLIKQVNDVKPTVILLCYGENESFEGKAGLAKFVEQYKVLLGDLEKTGARMVLISPPPHEKLPPPLPNPSAHNADLAIYCDAIKKIGDEHKLPFVDLFGQLAGEFGAHSSPKSSTLQAWYFTDNGVHLNAAGDELVAAHIDVLLCGAQPDVALQTKDRRVQLLCAAIIEKNRLYFCRYRPQNETYIYGFRKHEQGRNAVEIPEFDPLIKQQEKLIAELRKPQK